MNAELQAIDERLEEIRKRREQIGEELEALDDLDALVASGITPDPNNPAHRRLIQKAGIDPERMRGNAIAALIGQRRRDLDGENGQLDEEWNERMKRRGEIIAERREVRGALSDVNNADSEEARILAERRARTALGVQQLGEAVYVSERREARLIAADAVAANEQEPLQARARCGTDTSWKT